MDDPAIQNLIEQAKRGDHAAWKRLFAICQPTLLNQAQRLLGPTWHAVSPQDLVQITWTNAAQRIASYRGAGFQAWLSAIMRNAHLNLVRDPRRRMEQKRLPLPVAGPNDSTVQPGIEPTAEDSTALSAIQAAESALLVRQALAALDADQRQVLQLWMDEKLSFEAIAARLGWTARVVAARFHDGIGELRIKLQELRP
jgi:RNA polymerase sigma-70 factor (ECF subfamily)